MAGETGFGVGFNLDFSKVLADATKIDSKLENMVENSKKLQKNFADIFQRGGNANFLNILDRMSKQISELGSKKISPNFDLVKANELFKVMSSVVSTAEFLSKKKVELFDTNNLYATQKSLAQTTVEYEKIQDKIEKMIEEWEKLSKKTYVPKEWASANPDKLRKDGTVRSAYAQELADYKALKQMEIDIEMETLVEKRKIAQSDLNWSKKTQDEKLEKVIANINKATAEEKRQINEIRKEYQKLTSDQLDIISKSGKLEKSGIGKDGNVVQQEYERQFLERDKRRREIEEQYGQFVVDIAERSQRKILDAEVKRIKERREQEEKARVKYLSTPEGALSLAKDAKTVNDMKEAQKYLQIARDNTNVNQKEVIDELNKAYQRLRISIEQLTTAEKNEQTLQPTVRNEYARLLVELDKLAKAREKLYNTQSYKQGDSSTQNLEQKILDRERDVMNKIVAIQENAQGQLSEVKRKFLAESAIEETKQIERTEKANHEIRLRYLQQQQKERQKYRTIDSQTAERVIRMSNNSKNLAQEIAAVKALKNAREHLKNTDEKYKETLNRLNKEIEQHEKNIKKATGGTIDLNDKHKDLMDISGQLQRRLALVFSVSQITGYINKLVEVRGEFELQQRSLQAIIQNNDKANEIWAKTVDLAIRSPFRVKELVSYTKQLASYRVESDKLYETTKRLADVSAGLGVDMQRIILAYGQVKAANFLRGTELRQFSEAGINMLGELAKYFTEIENRAVSVADVFERVSKRGVSFGDVDAVFRRMTDAGGIFYQMQEKQAETLKGQMSNLGDSIDVMMDKIGEANDGYLKFMISLIRKIVENWEEVAAVVVPVITALITKWSIYGSIMKYNALVESGYFKSLNKNLKASIIYLTKGTTALKNYADANQLAATSIKGGVWGAVIGVAIATLASFGKTLYEHKQALDEITQKYDELVDKIADVSVAFRNAANNKDVKKQRTELERLVEIANTDYHMDIKINIEGLGDGDVIKKFSELEEQILNINSFSASFSKAYQKSTEWVATDDIRKDFSDLKNAYSNLTTEIINKKQRVLAALLPVKDTLNETQQAALKELNTSKKESETQLEYVNRLKDAYRTLLDENNKRREQIYKQWGNSYAFHEAMNKFNQYAAKAALDTSFWTPLFYRFDEDLEEAKGEFKNFIKNIYDDIKGLSKEEAEIKLNAAINKLAAEEKWNDFLKTTVKRWTEEHYVYLGVKLIKPDKKEEKNLLAWQKNYNNKFGDIPKTTDIDERLTGFKKITDSATKQKDEVERLQAEWASYNDIIKKIESIGVEKATGKGGAYEGIDYKKMIKDRADVEKQLDFFGEEYEKRNKTRDRSALERLKEQIRLVRELAKDYQKLWDEQGKVIADEKIWSEERKSAFSKVGLDYSQFNTGKEEDEVNNLRKLTDIAGELDKAIADASTELGSFKQQLSDAEFARYIEDLFGNYEVSLELSKLNIPQDMAKRLFGVDSIDLDDIRAEILNKVGLSNIQGSTNGEILNSENYLKLNKEQRKIVEDGLKKVEELEQKSLQERLKRYSQFLVKGQSERVKIKLEELRELEKLEEDYNNKRIEESDYKLARQGIKSESKEKLDKLEWDEFQNSSLYIQMFEDLETASTSALNKMREKLIEMREGLSELDLPSELKSINEQIEKIDEEAVKRNPIKGLATSLKGYIKYLKERKELERQIQEQRVKEENAQKDVKSKELDAAEKQVAYEKASKSKQASQEEVQNAFMAYRHSQNMLIAAKDRLDAEKKVTKELEEQQKKGAKDGKTFKESAFEVGSYISQYANALPQIAGELENVFGVMSDGTKDTIDSISTIAGCVGDAIQGFASGDYVQTVAGVAKALGGIFQIGDKKKEREIKRQQKLIEELGKQYEKLEEQIKKAYTVNDLKSSFDESMKNLEEQIAAREKMIAAEEDKKKKDNERIKQWQEEIAEIEKQKTEVLQSQVEELGGTYDFKSAAREFVDAWLDAFNESGNGLKGFEKQFNDFYMNIVRNQAVTRGASKILEPMLQEIDKALEGDFMVDKSENSKIQKAADYAGEQFNNFMMQMIENWGNSLTGQSNVELSGLQRGIQGVTEDTAEILASYLNSIRFFVSEQSDLLKQLVALQNDNNQTENPMVAQLKLVVRETTTIKEAIQSVIQANHKNGGSGIRVFID